MPQAGPAALLPLHRHRAGGCARHGPVCQHKRSATPASVAPAPQTYTMGTGEACGEQQLGIVPRVIRCSGAGQWLGPDPARLE